MTLFNIEKKVDCEIVVVAGDNKLEDSSPKKKKNRLYTEEILLYNYANLK